jgi:hypothetical protein
VPATQPHSGVSGARARLFGSNIAQLAACASDPGPYPTLCQRWHEAVPFPTLEGVRCAWASCSCEHNCSRGMHIRGISTSCHTCTVGASVTGNTACRRQRRGPCTLVGVWIQQRCFAILHVLDRIGPACLPTPSPDFKFFFISLCASKKIISCCEHATAVMHFPSSCTGSQHSARMSTRCHQAAVCATKAL